MNKEILKTGVQDFIIENLNADIVSVSLKKSPFQGVRSSELAQQLKGHQKIREKVPDWYAKKGLFFPPSLNLEQASSQATARYKSKLVGGKILMDITGGFGVDSYFLSQQFEHTDYYELNPELAEIVEHNFRILGAENIKVHPGDGMEALREKGDKGKKPDWVYADPSRRHQRKGKVIRLEDYQPDIPSNLPWILNACRNLLLKTSPMLDVEAGLQALTPVREIHIVAVQNEVRELLWWIDPAWSGETRIIAVDLQQDARHTFAFTQAEAMAAPREYSQPLEYLYEPNAAMLKSGAFDLIGQRYGLKKLHRNTHLFTSNELIAFPGRRFSILEVLPYKPGRLDLRQGHVSARNFPESVDLIRKRNRIRPGGSDYFFFVRSADEGLKVLKTKKV